MKKINLISVKSYLSRDEMRVVSGGARALCNNGTSVSLSNCEAADFACRDNGGAKICSGGPQQ